MRFLEGRKFLKALNWKNIREEADQRRGVDAPPLQKRVPAGAKLIKLPDFGELVSRSIPLVKAIENRQSIRSYAEHGVTLEELSFLLWATQGVRKVLPNKVAAFRTVPSGGARHAFETYVYARMIEGLDSAIYRYVPLDHALYEYHNEEKLDSKIVDACLDQKFVASGAAVFFWSVIPYRAEWRYASVAHKMLAIDAGHVCQNLYLACETIDCGTCAIGAYDQEAVDQLLKLDGIEEFVIYLAPVGKKKQSDD
ncbi:MAG TPA: hypothetical protein DCE14_06730 [Kosmotogaceae bacterium]|nr:MAG: SagB-type dehydrogenase domain protein [Thermotogales bacterium 46_20]HAA86020.1 hypothetical protein [Kosmotogaceae bacterium]